MKHSAWNRFIGVTLVFFLALVAAALVGCSARRGPEEATLPPVAKEPVAIKGLTFSEQEGYTRVAIEGSRPIDYESIELLEDPLRISLEIPNATLEVATPVSVNNGTVTEISGLTSGDRTKIEIGLADKVDYSLTQEMNSLYIDIEKATEAQASRPVRPAVIEEVKKISAMGPARALTGVSVAKHGNTTEVTITADGIIGDYNAFTLGSPPRLVIDLWKLKSKFPKNSVSANTPNLRRIRIGEHPKKMRLVLDAVGTKPPRYRIEGFQNQLVVLLGDVKALKGEGIGILGAVDFKQIDDRSRVVLSSSQKVDYEIFKASPEDIVVDLKKTIAPRRLRRFFDTSAFDSPVDSIRLYNVRSETSRDVRVVIHLGESVDFEAYQEGERIFVDFQKPQTSKPELTTQPTRPESAEPVESATLEQERTVQDVEEEKSQAAPGSPSAQKEEAVSREPGAEGAAPEKTVSSETKTEQAATTKAEEGRKASPRETSAPSLSPAKAAGKEHYYELALTPGKEYTGRRISLDFKDADIKNILRLIAEVSNLNIVAGDDVKGKVTIRLIDVPWDQALDIILFSNKLGKMRMGNVVRVAPVEVLKKEEEELLSSKRTKEKLEDLVTELIPVNYSSAQELQAQVKNLLSERGSVSIDTRTNTLVIKDIPKNVSEAKELVRRLDSKTPQVVIEARFVEASSSFSRELGIKWGGQAGYDSAGNPTMELGGSKGTLGIKGGISTNTAANFPVAGATSGIVFNLAGLGDITSLDIELSALEESGEGEIISAPRITTIDNKEASIEQGLRIPYLKLTAEGTATTEFIEANVNLRVTPHVTNDGHVKMNIKASKDSPDDSITVQGVPAIDKKEAITEVLVEDGDVVVIAGLYSIERSHNVGRIPLLGKIPLVGFLFRNTEIQDDRRDLLIFISPKIVKGREPVV